MNQNTVPLSKAKIVSIACLVLSVILTCVSDILHGVWPKLIVITIAYIIFFVNLISVWLDELRWLCGHGKLLVWIVMNAIFTGVVISADIFIFRHSFIFSRITGLVFLMLLLFWTGLPSIFKIDLQSEGTGSEMHNAGN